MLRSLVITSLGILFATVATAEERTVRASDFLRANRASTATTATNTDFRQLQKRIATRPDPESKFGYIVFSVARHRNQLLSDEQATQLDTLIDARRNAAINWHDVRNIVRVHAVIAMWDYAQSRDDSVSRYRKTWEAWTDLRLAYMFEEFIVAERFHRAFWAILNTDQRAKLLSGEWDSYLKKSTGHKRLFSAGKQVRRVMGKPDHPEAFDRASTLWNERWQAMHQGYLAASKFQRQRQFSMDLTDEDFDVEAWDEYATAFRAFVTMECDAVRDILQTGYDLDAAATAQLDQTRDQLHTDMIEKYRPGCSDFLRAIGAIKAD